MSNSLKHVGVLGMRWGVRRSHSADYLEVKSIRKKKMKDMTDEEVKKASKRFQLETEYKNSFKKNILSKTSHLSNDELSKTIDRLKLEKADWTSGVRKNKKIQDMSDEEVRETLKRYNLEKKYKELDTSMIARGRRKVEIWLKNSGLYTEHLTVQK